MENGATRRMDIGSFLDHHTEANGLEWRRRLPIPLTRFISPIRSGKSTFYKYAMRSSIDFPLVNFAVSCNDRNEKNGTRVAVGAVASRPRLAEETAALFGDADRSEGHVDKTQPLRLHKDREMVNNAGNVRHVWAQDKLSARFRYRPL